MFVFGDAGFEFRIRRNVVIALSKLISGVLVLQSSAAIHGFDKRRAVSLQRGNAVQSGHRLYERSKEFRVKGGRNCLHVDARCLELFVDDVNLVASVTEIAVIGHEVVFGVRRIKDSLIVKLFIGVSNVKGKTGKIDGLVFRAIRGFGGLSKNSDAFDLLLLRFHDEVGAGVLVSDPYLILALRQSFGIFGNYHSIRVSSDGVRGAVFIIGGNGYVARI